MSWNLLRVALLGALISLGVIGCGGETPDRVVLYSSVDDYLLREVIARIERETGLRVEVVGDTELTKTTGLVERLIAERDRARADVWWSSEAFGTIRLAREGVLSALGVAGRDGDALWADLAPRARVIAYASDRLAIEEVPRSLAELTDARFRGRVGIARPQFGTTRGHMGALRAVWGEGVYGDWVGAMRANGVRILEGNASVVREIARGTIDIGLTDSDDVFAARREGQRVAYVYERRDEERAGEAWSPGVMVMPNTVARVRGGANPEGATALIEEILSERTERLMMESDSRNFPVRESVRRDGEARGLWDEMGPPSEEMVMRVALQEAESAIESAIAAWE